MSLKSIIMALSLVAVVQVFGAHTASAQSAKADQESLSKTIKIQSGDTLSSIAEAHDTTYIRLFNANEKIANPDVINVDDEIRIPTPDEELKDRFAEYTVSQPIVTQTNVRNQPTSTYNTPTYSQPSAPTSAYNTNSAGNTYAYGWCTWYVKSRKANIPNNWGSAAQWVSRASASGYATGTTPLAGAIGAAGNHVVYVESVNGDMVTISEMAYAGGIGVQHFRTVPANSFYYIYA